MPCVAAIVLESIPGTAGIMPPPPGYLAGVRELCDRHGIVYIADEVMAGFGRSGRWFAFEHFDVVPDLITFAKGVNSGYVPLGGVVISAAIAATFADRAYPGGLTYSGHPLACASAVASIGIFKEEGILESGDALTLGIGVMTDAVMQDFYAKMVAAGLVPEGIDIAQSYTTQFVGQGVGMDLLPQ